MINSSVQIIAAKQTLKRCKNEQNFRTNRLIIALKAYEI